jgi:RecA-family ATPase
MSGNGRPFDGETERELLGSLFKLPAAWDTPEVLALSPHHFGDVAHQHIFAAMLDVRRRGEDLTAIHIHLSLKTSGLLDPDQGKFDPAGGLAHLSAVLAAGGTGSSARTYADVVLDYHHRRILRDMALRVIDETDHHIDPIDIIGGVEQHVEEFKQSRVKVGGPQTMAARIKENRELRPIVIDSIARVGEVVNVVAPSKRGKSWLVLLLLLCFVASKRLFDAFGCAGGKALLIDNELHRETSDYRVKAVAKALGLKDEDWTADFLIDNVRGQGLDIHGLVRYLAPYGPGDFAVIVLDALYRFYPPGFNENEAAQMTNLYNILDGIANRLQCVIICIVHSSKGSQADKSVVDVGSGSGAMARAPDTHIAIREHEEPGCVVFDKTTRSFPPSHPLCLRWNWPLWVRDDTLDPDKLFKPGRKAKEKPIETVWTAELFVERFATPEPKVRAVLADDAIAAGIKSSRKLGELINAAVARGKLFEWPTGDGRQPAYSTVKPPEVAAKPRGRKPRKGAR